MKIGIREKITILLCLGLELGFLECWLRLGGMSIWDYIEPLCRFFPINLNQTVLLPF